MFQELPDICIHCWIRRIGLNRRAAQIRNISRCTHNDVNVLLQLNFRFKLNVEITKERGQSEKERLRPAPKKKSEVGNGLGPRAESNERGLQY